ncbi:MAG: Na+/H+ antiporter NhaA [Alphaproteobacteria bacterium]
MLGSRYRFVDAATRALRAFVAFECAGGIVLMAAAAVALVLSNSPFSAVYDAILDTPVVVSIGSLALDKPLLLWINDGLMAIFFFLVGLELKREVIEGRLSSLAQAGLPVIAALGGMIVPALIYIALNLSNPDALSGWAIPAATDIAFAIGVLALLGARVPVALKVFLLALAIIDDLGAIVIIALFYTSGLSLAVLVAAAAGVAVLWYMNRRGVVRTAAYVTVGLIIWVCVLKSGVHATLAGVVVALFIPLRTSGKTEASPLLRIEHGLAPWVAFGVIPVFAFANAGVSLHDISIGDLTGGVPLGIALGLFIGKQAGIMSFVFVAVKLRAARLPPGVTWGQIYGVSVLAGIGFTMSLFIGTLAFSDPSSAAAVRIGVLSGSIISAIVGYAILHATLRQPDHARASGPAIGSHAARARS